MHAKDPTHAWIHVYTDLYLFSFWLVKRCTELCRVQATVVKVFVLLCLSQKGYSMAAYFDETDFWNRLQQGRVSLWDACSIGSYDGTSKRLRVSTESKLVGVWDLG